MSTPNQPDDKNVEGGAVAPPWKRAEASAATGLTAGEMAKAAGALKGERGGPPPRGVVSGSTPVTGPNLKAGPMTGAPASGNPASGNPAPTGPVSGTSGSGSTPQVSPTPAPGQNTPAPGTPAPGAAPVSGPTRPSAGTPSAGTAGPQPAAGKAAGPDKSTTGGAGKHEPFVESKTRNIPRDELVHKEKLPDLDSIHHTEQAKEQALARAASQTIPARSVGVPLRAAVQVRRVDPWSIFKVSGVLSIAGFFIWMIAVAILYGVLGGMGIWDQINSSFGTIVNGDGSTSGQDLISGGQVFMFSALFGAISAVLITALLTISAYIYNVFADMVGGVEVTLADLD